MKDWTPILFTGGILLLIVLFAPRLLDILEQRTTNPAVDDLVAAIGDANAKAAEANARAAEANARAAEAKTAADKAAADAAAAKKTP